jgi:transcriptional regulator with XRE-family HTH domain
MKLISNTFGRRLSAVRIDRGLTQAELGAAIGMYRQLIARWEGGGIYAVDIRAVRKCARVLHCRVKDLSAPLDAPLPTAPAYWARNRWRAKLRQRQTAVAAGVKPPPWVRRFAAAPHPPRS